jgi:hypothetical protein
MINGFGPTTFSVTIGKWQLTHCIKLTATVTPGEFSMWVGEEANGGCSAATLHQVATVTLDANNSITACVFSGRFGSRNWKTMTGTFETDGTGGGEIEDAGDPTGANGVWAAGGTEPLPHRHEHKHGHHA